MRRYTKNEVKQILEKGSDLQSWPWSYEEIKTPLSWQSSLKAALVRTRSSRLSKWIDSVVRAGNRGRRT